jgi:hypothetical protein
MFLWLPQELRFASSVTDLHERSPIPQQQCPSDRAQQPQGGWAPRRAERPQNPRQT